MLQLEISVSTSNQQELLEHAHQGDAVALNELLQNNRPMIHSRAAATIPRGLRIKIDPSDLTQDTLADAYRQLPTLQNISVAGFQCWLTGILENNLKESLRHLGRSKRDSKRLSSDNTPLMTLASREATPSTLASRGDSAALLQRLVEQLKPELKAAVWLRYRENLSYAEIALRLNLEIPAVERLLSRAKLALRNLLPPEEAPT